MPDERDSPSGGWRGVYGAMSVRTGADDGAHRCPDCGARSHRGRDRRRRCPEREPPERGEDASRATG